MIIMGDNFNEQDFEKRLVNLKDTQESIGALSNWCLTKKEHHKKIVNCWLHCLKRVKIDHRLSLFYLANDVIQYSKRKHYDFVESWGTALQKATPLVRDDKVKNKILRIFKIWDERGVYDEAFIADLCGLLTTSVKKKAEQIEVSTDPNEFQPTLLVRKIKEVKSLRDNSHTKFKRIKDNKLSLTDAESMRLSLKDRRHGSDVAAEVESGVKKMEAYVRALETEVSGREKLIELLRQATVYYETQRGEAKIVANAYRSFGGRLKTHQKAVEDLMAELISPQLSPDVNAPSPSPDYDPEASGQTQEAQQVAAHEQEQIAAYAPEMYVPQPSQHHMEQTYQPYQPQKGEDLDFSASLVNSSFIGSGQILELSKEIFHSETGEHESLDNAQAIQVIGNQNAGAGADFDVAEFFKSLMPAKDPPQLPPPPMPPAFANWGASGPWDQPPPETPQSPPAYEKQVPMVQPIEYDDSHPLAPVPDMDHRNLMVPPPELPDMDHRQPPPSIIGLDMDHRGVPMHSMDHSMPPPIISERGTLIPPQPVPLQHPPVMGNMLGPPPPPPPLPVKALIDVDQRNLIKLTGSPRAANSNNFTVPQQQQQQQLGYQNEASNSNNNSHSVKHHGGRGGRGMWNHRQQQQEQGREPTDIVEAVDMDVSDDDESHAHNRTGNDQSYPPVFNPPPAPTSMLRPAYLQESEPEVMPRNNMPQRGGFRGPPPQRVPQEDNFLDDESFDIPPNNSEPVFMGNDHYEPPFRSNDQNFEEEEFQEEEDYQDVMHERLGVMQNAGAKLIAALDEPEENGWPQQPHRGGFRGGPRWRSPRGHRPPRSNFPYRSPQFRGHPRMFRPRGRW